MSIGLALSGGFVKGAAHIGVLQALEEENIKVDYISGTSSGSIVATLYAAGYSPNSILTLFNMYCKQIISFDKKVLMRLVTNFYNTISRDVSLANGENIEMVIRHTCGMKKIYNINQIKMPLAIPTVDINSGKIIYFTNREVIKIDPDLKCFNNVNYEYSGNISSIVMASCSYPAIFSPKRYKGYNLVDGGVRLNTPVSILKALGADKVIGVTFNNNKSNRENCMLSVVLKSLDIMGDEINKEEVKNSDFNISLSIPSCNMFESNYINMYANLGYRTTKSIINEIKS